MMYLIGTSQVIIDFITIDKTFLEAKASKGMHAPGLKNHLTATYPYMRAENSSTGCTLHLARGFCKMF